MSTSTGNHGSVGSTAIGSIPLTGTGVYTPSPGPSATRSNHSSFPGTRRRKLEPAEEEEEHDGHPPQQCSRDELLPCCGFFCCGQNRAKVHYDYDIISFAVNFHPNRATLWGLSGRRTGAVRLFISFGNLFRFLCAETFFLSRMRHTGLNLRRGCVVLDG